MHIADIGILAKPEKNTYRLENKIQFVSVQIDGNSAATVVLIAWIKGQFLTFVRLSNLPLIMKL